MASMKYVGRYVCENCGDMLETCAGIPTESEGEPITDVSQCFCCGVGRYQYMKLPECIYKENEND